MLRHAVDDIPVSFVVLFKEILDGYDTLVDFGHVILGENLLVGFWVNVLLNLIHKLFEGDLDFQGMQVLEVCNLLVLQ